MSCDSERALSRGFLCLTVGLTVVLALVLFAMAATEWREFRTPDGMGHDLAIYNQGFYLALNAGGWFRTTLDLQLGSVRSVLASHFAPNFYLLLPFYAVWQSPLLLLLLASFTVAAGGAAVFLIARWMFRSTAAAAVWFGLFALYPPVPFSVPVNGFRETFVAVGFLSFALLYYLRRRDRLFFLMLVLALLSKEDIALLLPVWGGVAWSQGRGPRLAGAVALLGVAYFLLVNAVILPMMRGGQAGHMYFAGFASPLGFTLNDLLHSPSEVARLALSQRNLRYLAAVFSPLMFLPLLGWEYVMIPALVYVEIALAPMFQTIESQHIAPALPFIFVAAMVGTSRLVNLVMWVLRLSTSRAVVVRNVGFAVLVCSMAASAAYSTSLLGLVQGNWPTDAGLRRDAPFLQALTRIPPQASVAATQSVMAESSTRDVLYAFIPREMAAHEPDYIAVDVDDLNDPLEARAWIISPLCEGTYGVVYADRRGTRFLLERGAGLAGNAGVYAVLFPASGVDCPISVQKAASPQMFARAASFHVRSRFPSEVQPTETFPEPVAAVSDTRFSQVIHLPDHAFAPGRYRLDLTGAWPWLWAPASYRLTAWLLVGERTVGHVTADGDQPLRYATAPFLIDRRATLPLRVRVELQTPGGPAGTVWALGAARNGCAVVADAPSLNPQRLTVEAWVYLDEPVQRPGTESEAPILSKGSAPGYYLRISGDDQRRLWADLNVAGKWAAGRAGFVPVRKWTHIAATYDGREVGIYINGERALQDPGRSPRHTGRVQSGGVPLAIGCRDPGTRDEAVFPGLVESASVWNRVLTAQEIRERAVTWFAPTPDLQGLVGSWDFRGPRGDIVPDLSMEGNRITNGAALTRVPAPEITQPVAAWRSRELNVLRLVTITRLP